MKQLLSLRSAAVRHLGDLISVLGCLGIIHKSRNRGSKERLLNLVTRCPFGKQLSGSRGRTAKTDMGLPASPTPPVGFHYIDYSGFECVADFLLPAKCMCHYV